MINNKILEAIENEKKADDFLYPFYDQYCFSNIPSTILKFFDIKTKKSLPSEMILEKTEFSDTNKLILLIIDGFGYNQWLRYYNDHKFFARLTREGTFFPITTVFPSTTANAITTINTGLTPQEHALPEWFVYFKEIDQIINTVHFKPLGSQKNDELDDFGVKSKILYDGNTFYQTLNKEGIKAYTFIDESMAESSYSKLIFKGSAINSAITNSDLLVKLRKNLEKTEGSAYNYVYLGNLDSAAHRYGPHTEEYKTELESINFLLKKELTEKIKQKTAKESLIIVTADHGQLNINPKETIYLNNFKKLQQNFQKSQNNKTILPTGSPRDIFLHIKPNKIQQTHELLTEKLAEKAKIIETEEAIKNGLFGSGEPKEEFYDRIGNLLIVPHGNQTIWYKHPLGRSFDLLGFHGGLNREEMLVPYAASKLSKLK
ncbi:MAG: alkaline phosphatase family protein [Candidatus Bathyarchaeota archaeon]